MSDLYPHNSDEFPIYELEDNTVYTIEDIPEIVVDCTRCGAELNTGTAVFKFSRGSVGKGDFERYNNMFEFEEESYIYLCECCVTMNRGIKTLYDLLEKEAENGNA